MANSYILYVSMYIFINLSIYLSIHYIYLVLFWLCNLLWDNLLYLISSLTLMGLVTTLDSSDIFQDYGGTGNLNRILATSTKYL